MLVLFPIMLIAFGAYFAAASALTNIPGRLALTLPAATVVFTIGLLFLLPRSGGSLFPWDPETPAGPRWEIAGLTQLPGTRLTGIQLALRTLDTIPPTGAVIVATANSEDLYRQCPRATGPIPVLSWLICAVGHTPMAHLCTIPGERLPSAGVTAIRRPSSEFLTTIRDAERAC